MQAAVNVLIVDDQSPARTMLRHVVERISTDIRIADFKTKPIRHCGLRSRRRNPLLLKQQAFAPTEDGW